MFGLSRFFPKGSIYGTLVLGALSVSPVWAGYAAATPTDRKLAESSAPLLECGESKRCAPYTIRRIPRTQLVCQDFHQNKIVGASPLVIVAGPGRTGFKSSVNRSSRVLDRRQRFQVHAFGNGLRKRYYTLLSEQRTLFVTPGLKAIVSEPQAEDGHSFSLLQGEPLSSTRRTYLYSVKHTALGYLEPQTMACARVMGRTYVIRQSRELAFKEPAAGICNDTCGDGVCAEVVCLAEGCPCAETRTSCPMDCA